MTGETLPVDVTMLSYIQLSKDNLLHNLNQFKRYLHQDTKICVPIKGNAYGHGQNEVANILKDHVDYLLVDDINELRVLPDELHKKTLVLGYIEKNELEEVILSGAVPVMYDIERLQTLEKIGLKLVRKIPVHIKVDVYHGRQGVLVDELEVFIKQLRQLQFIDVQGVAAHFSSSDDLSDWEHTTKQINSFKQVKQLFSSAGYQNLLYNISNTGGILTYEQGNHENEMVRLGIGVYGMWPSEDLHQKYIHLELKPIIRWATHVADIKTLPPDHPVGYNRTFVTDKLTRIAIIPQGYSDGYDRGLSNKGEVLINGKKCRVLGRVAMNMFSVDVSNIPDIRQENEVILLGKQGLKEITAEEIAAKLETINYEITTRLSPLLPRVIV